MAKLKNPLLSLDARNSLGKALTFVKRRGQNIAESYPLPDDPKSLAQLSWRHMYQKAAALWNALSPAEKKDWESQATPRHMTGYAWFMSQALKPNPGLYLPLQGGNMQGEIDMDGNPIEDLPDPTNPQDADTQAARDAAIAAALADPFDVHLYGYDGSNWQTLRVQSASSKNLRTIIYQGDTPASVDDLDNTLTNDAGLVVKAVMMGQAAANNFQHPTFGKQNVDNLTGAIQGQTVRSCLHGYDGNTWDRLRAYNTGILKVGRAAVGLLDIRMTGTGQVGATGARKLYWMLLNPSAGNSIFELTDATAGGSPVKIDHFDTSRDGHMITFDPPVEFSNGIYLETFTNMTSIIFGYL